MYNLNNFLLCSGHSELVRERELLIDHFLIVHSIEQLVKNDKLQNNVRGGGRLYNNETGLNRE